MASIHFLEFRTREGQMALQRVDHISTILETTLTPKGGESRTIMYLLLQNMNRIEVVGETRDSIMHRLMSCTGSMPVVVVGADPAEEAAEA